ncbi:MAG: YitT family protein [Candidatus Limivicinus sp.]|nr:YitT family protein [Candidatus Limivicinus sp.]
MQKLMEKMRSYLMIALGTALTAAAFGLIVLPQGLAAGGITGLSVLLSRVMPLPVSAIVFVLNAGLFLLGWACVGRDFAFKTLLVSLLFPVLLELFQRLDLLAELSADPLISSLLAGGMLGFGTGLVLLGNGSCGGFDILGVVLNKKLGVPVSLVMFLCDGAVLIAQALKLGILNTVYGVLVILVSSFTINRVLTNGKEEGQMLIFSQKYEEIRRALLDDQDVGLTFLNGETGYMRRPIKVIVTVMPHSKIENVKKAVYGIDPTAFLLLNSTRYVGGKGYTISR